MAASAPVSVSAVRAPAAAATTALLVPEIVVGHERSNATNVQRRNVGVLGRMQGALLGASQDALRHRIVDAVVAILDVLV